MPTEIEAKYLDIDHKLIRSALEKLDAIRLQPMRLMKRINYDYPDNRLGKRFNGWVRLRDEANKFTVSYKTLNKRTLHGTSEVDFTVDSFEKADLFLRSIGLEKKTYQETKRESWELDNVKVELDIWPWIRPFIEIEADNEEAVWRVAETLGLSKEKAVFGSVEIAYQAEYDVTEDEVDNWDELVFRPVPEWLQIKRKKLK